MTAKRSFVRRLARSASAPAHWLDLPSTPERWEPLEAGIEYAAEAPGVCSLCHVDLARLHRIANQGLDLDALDQIVALGLDWRKLRELVTSSPEQLEQLAQAARAKQSTTRSEPESLGLPADRS